MTDHSDDSSTSHADAGRLREESPHLQSANEELQSANDRLHELVDSLKKAEETARESEARFRLLADNVPVLIWVDDAQGHRFVNRPYFEFVGAATRDDENGAHWRAFIHPEDRDRYFEAYREAASRNAPFEVQVRFRRADGEYRWMKSIATPRAASGPFAGYVGSKTDVTDLKDAEQALLRADRNKDEFLAMLAHELRNPLAPIRNVVQLLQMRGADEATVNWALGTLDRQVRNISQLVDDLLDVSRITHGKINLRRRSVDLGAIVMSAVESILPTIQSCDQKLELDLPQTPLPVTVDSLRIEQVITNLLNNASKFTPEGGHIWVSARTVTPAADGTDGAVEIAEVSVRDDGRGIEPDAIGEVFELFAQGDRSLERKHGGLGVGLTVARRLVEMHDGGLTVTSPGLGRGSNFAVRLPLTPAMMVEPFSPAPAISRPTTAALHVLIVDDNVDASDALGMLLKMEGHSVEVAHDGDAGIDAALRFHPDAVLLDIGLPVRSGYEVARELRARPETRSTLLIAVTGYGGPLERKKAEEAGFDHHLTKPVDLAVLTGLLSTRMPAAQM